ncbi:MAG: sensor histidine kinase, partial [Bryobacteraceae bacterium]
PAAAEAMLEQVRSGETVRGLEGRLRVRDGSVKEVLIGANGRWEGGRLVYVRCFTTDITERKRAEEDLKRTAAELGRSNADLQQFAYVASHDLKEPLRMVAGFTQLLARRYGDKFDSTGEEFLSFVTDGVARMQALIDDLLQYSRVGSRPKKFEPVDTAEVVQQALANLGKALEESDAEVSARALPQVTGDPVQLVQLFQNLIGNAVKFRAERKPAVKVAARRKGDEWVFLVRDNGIGFEAESYDRIFEIFQRLHGKAEYPGTGIGLAVCKKIVERHGGRIWVDSKPGEGSTFYFSLPAAAPEGARGQAATR